MCPEDLEQEQIQTPDADNLTIDDYNSKILATKWDTTNFVTPEYFGHICEVINGKAVANPSEVGEADSLEYLKIDGKSYKISGGIQLDGQTITQIEAGDGIDISIANGKATISLAADYVEFLKNAIEPAIKLINNTQGGTDFDYGTRIQVVLSHIEAGNANKYSSLELHCESDGQDIILISNLPVSTDHTIIINLAEDMITIDKVYKYYIKAVLANGETIVSNNIIFSPRDVIYYGFSKAVGNSHPTYRFVIDETIFESLTLSTTKNDLVFDVPSDAASDNAYYGIVISQKANITHYKITEPLTFDTTLTPVKELLYNNKTYYVYSINAQDYPYIIETRNVVTVY